MPNQAGTRKREKKKNRSEYCFSRSKLERSQKNCKKIQKIKKRHSNFISSQTGLGQAKKEIKKKFVFYLTRAGAFLEK